MTKVNSLAPGKPKKGTSQMKSKGHDDVPKAKLPESKSKNDSKGKKGGGGGKTYGAFGGYKGVKVKTAKDLIRPQIKQQLKGLKREKRQINRSTRDGMQDARNLYQRSVGDLNHVYGESQEFIDGRNQETQAQFEATRNRAMQAQQALAQQLAASGQVNAQGANDELARLGIEGSGNMGQFGADQAFAEQTGALNSQNSIATLDLMNSGATTVGNMLSGMNSGSQAASLGQATNTRNDMFRDLKNNKMDAMLDVRQAMRDAKSSRPDLVNSMLQQLAQTGWAQYMDSKNLSLQQQQLNLQKQAQAFAQKQALKASGGGGGGSSSGGGYSGGSSSSSSGGGGSSSGSNISISGAPKPQPKPKSKPKKVVPNFPDHGV